MKFINVPTFDTIEKLMSINETGEIELNDNTYLDSIDMSILSAADPLLRSQYLKCLRLHLICYIKPNIYYDSSISHVQYTLVFALLFPKDGIAFELLNLYFRIVAI